MKTASIFRVAGTLFPVIVGLGLIACVPSFRVGSNSPVQPAAPYTSSAKASKPKTEIDLSLKNNLMAIECYEHFKSGDFAWLEKTIDGHRKTKERVQGGLWLLHADFVALERPIFNSTDASDDEWSAHFENLRKWKSAYPDSISARIVSARSWITYAWEARGGGPANTVSDANLKIFQQRIIEAQTELSEAKRSEQKCPEWYVAALLTARAMSADWEDYNRIYEEGFKLEPAYYCLHNEKAMYLLPRWGGNDGDWPKFAEETANRVGGDEGKMVYFIMVADMYRAYRSKIFRENNLSWDKIKAGFNAMQAKHGTGNARLNDFAALALHIEDYESAKTAFDAIGDKWDEDVWREKDRFDGAKMITKVKLQTPEERLASMRGPAPSPGQNNPQNP